MEGSCCNCNVGGCGLLDGCFFGDALLDDVLFLGDELFELFEEFDGDEAFKFEDEDFFDELLVVEGSSLSFFLELSEVFRESF